MAEQKNVRADERAPRYDANGAISLEVARAALRRQPVEWVGIVAHALINGVVHYRLKVATRDVSWGFLVRFAHFARLNEAMEKMWENRASYQDPLPPFPEKHSKLFVDHKVHRFIAQRRMLLDNYLHQLSRTRAWRTSRTFLSFCLPGRHSLPVSTVPHQAFVWARGTKGEADALKRREKDEARRIRKAADKAAAEATKRAEEAAARKQKKKESGEEEEEEEEEEEKGVGAGDKKLAKDAAKAEVDDADEEDQDDEVRDVAERPEDDEDFYDDDDDEEEDDDAADEAAQQAARKARAAKDKADGDDDNDDVYTGHNDVLADDNQVPEVTTVSIPSAQVLRNDHAIFQVDVSNTHRENRNFQSWVVLKRFSEFVELDVELQAEMERRIPEMADRMPRLPPKHFKMVVNHLEPTFIERRRLLLEHYLREIIDMPFVRHSESLHTFLGV